MKNSNQAIYFVLLINLYFPAAMAEDLSIPDKNHRQGMSYEEYSSFREKMRMRMEKMTPEERRQSHESSNHPAAQGERPKSGSAYGQGFHSRNKPEDKPDTDTANRPERPHFERLNRVDRPGR
jgi:hypothetical protein